MATIHHHQISSCKPTWCFRPPPTKETAKKSAEKYTMNTSLAATSSSCYVNKYRHGHRTASIGPLSPKVGCMGQIIKRGKPNSRSSVSASASSLSSSGSSTWWRGRSTVWKLITRAFLASSQMSSKVDVDDYSGVEDSVDVVAHMDPPLPVLRRGATRSGNSISLWERRCGKGGPNLCVVADLQFDIMHSVM